MAEFDKYAEDDDEDYEDVFGKSNGPSAVSSDRLKLTTKLSDRSWFGDNDSDEEDPFAEVSHGARFL